MPIIFADRKKMAAIASGKSLIEAKPEVETDADMKALQALVLDLWDAEERKSASDYARALKAFFYICDAMPHAEGEHEEE